MKVLTYNIHGWRAADGAFNLDPVAEVIAAAAPDIVGLNEVYHPWPTPTGDAAALPVLARRLGMNYAFGAAMGAGEMAAGVPYGNALLSRWLILAYAAHHLPAPPVGERRLLLEARVLLPAGHPLTVYVTHLDHRDEEARLAQWSAASAWLTRDRNRPHLLMGDFNALAAADYASPADVEALAAENRAQGWLPPTFALTTALQKAGYRDAFLVRPAGPGPTWPAATPTRRIDYIFLPQTHTGTVVSCRAWGHRVATAASDHLPVLAEFTDDGW